jgi:hypothetical protein
MQNDMEAMASSNAVSMRTDFPNLKASREWLQYLQVLESFSYRRAAGSHNGYCQAPSAIALKLSKVGNFYGSNSFD